MEKSGLQLHGEIGPDSRRSIKPAYILPGVAKLTDGSRFDLTLPISASPGNCWP